MTEPSRRRRLDPIREWDRSGFKSFDEWPKAWRRAAGIFGLVWLTVVVTIWAIQGNLLVLIGLPYLGVGFVYFLAVTFDRDGGWRKLLNRASWIGFVMTFAALVAAVIFAQERS